MRQASYPKISYGDGKKDGCQQSGFHGRIGFTAGLVGQQYARDTRPDS
jgi:hypothetical protein